MIFRFFLKFLVRGGGGSVGGFGWRWGERLGREWVVNGLCRIGLGSLFVFFV